jgi:hypothetical protein
MFESVRESRGFQLLLLALTGNGANVKSEYSVRMEIPLG